MFLHLLCGLLLSIKGRQLEQNASLSRSKVAVMSPTPGGKVSKHLTELTPNHRQQPVLAKMVNLQVMDDKRLPIAPSALHTLIFNSNP